MSTDWYLFSPSHKVKAMVGSVGLGGVKVWPTDYQGAKMIGWAIENYVVDVILTFEDDPRLEDEEVKDFDGAWRPHPQ